MDKLQIATLNLFNSFAVEADKKTYKYTKNQYLRMLKNGYILDTRVHPTESNLSYLDELVGRSGEKLNATFHKSWAKVATSNIVDLWVEQMFHYITTYGFESLGIYDERFVYIPNDKLEIPELKVDIPLLYIGCLTPDEILERIISLGSSSVALSNITLSYIMDIVSELNFDISFVEEIKNRELYSRLCDFYNIVPTEPSQFVRWLVYKLTGDTLVIKNRELIGKIKSASQRELDKYLKYAPDNLASVFFRYKPLFLAMKSISENKTFFNRLRKQAEYMHIPVRGDFLNSVTEMISNKTLNIDALEEHLSNATVWRKIRLLNALDVRNINGLDKNVIKVRNGKNWVTDFYWSGGVRLLNKVRKMVVNSIISNLSVGENSIVYIPSNVFYGLPATEKQFNGNVPNDTYISVTKNVLVGIHWYNMSKGNSYKSRVDLDLSLMDINGKYGWDGAYRSRSRDLLFSGDVVDAPRPNGASEFFYMAEGLSIGKIMDVRNYTRHNETEFKLIVAEDTVNGNFSQGRSDRNHYMVDPNKILFTQNFKFTGNNGLTIGAIVPFDGETRVYLVGGGGTDTNISARVGKYSTEKLNFYLDTLVHKTTLNDLLIEAGVNIISELPDEEIDFIDLSPESLGKDTILSLFNQNK